jgi:electron transfer flavoprotein alpha subunit
MESKDYKGILIFAEQRNGKIENVSFELLNAGRMLSDKLGVSLSAVLIGNNIRSEAGKLIEYGADKVFVYDNHNFSDYSDEVVANTLSKLVEKEKPEIFLIGATSLGTSFAPRLAARLNTGLTAHCTSLEIDDVSKNLKQIRPSFGGNIMVNIITPNHRPQMATVCPKVFKPAKPDNSRKGEIIECAVGGEISSKVKFIEFVKDFACEEDISEAKIIAAGGRGANAEGFKLIKELAKLLGAAVGASRPAVDSGLVPHSYQIGQTGKNVSPKIYIACAISGQIHHTIGIGKPEVIIAINKDVECPMMKIANYAIEGDMYEIIPAIIEEIRTLRK